MTSIILPSKNYLLDTTVFIDYWRNPSPVVRDLFLNAILHRNCGYSVITAAELWHGVSDTQSQEDHNLLLKPFILYELNLDIAKRGGQLSRIYQLKIVDALIAATAEYHRLVIITRNTRDFHHIPDHVERLFYDHPEPKNP